MTIWKFELPSQTGDFTIETPRDCHFLTVQLQDGYPVMWALVDPITPKTTRSVRIYFTGSLTEEHLPSSYVGTFQLPNGLVYHVFA